MFLLILSTMAGIVNKGNQFFREGKYDSALIFYGKAELLSPQHPLIKYNKGVALYKLGRFDEAEKSLLEATKSKNPVLRERAFFGLGNVYYRKGDLSDAIKSYISALKLNPFDREAKKNLEMCLKQKKEKKNKNNKGQNKNKKENKNKEKEQERKSPQQKQELQAIQNELKKELEKFLRKKKGKGGGSVRDW